ncbi:MAG: MaoC family dehydratase [Fusobacteriaceae bacterium]
MKFLELKIGMSDSITKTITPRDVDLFAEISMDRNPVHLDEEYASKTMFKKRIAHGILVTGLISAVLGTKLPGEGAIYMGQEIKFMAPVFLGDTITAKVEVIELISEKNRVVVSTTCTNQDGKVVISGKATLLQKN